MPNLLLDKLPTELEVDGVFYTIDADFRNCLLILSAFEDPDLEKQEAAGVMVYRLFNETPHDPEAAALVAVDFLNCGEALQVGKDGQLYSFSKDSKYIRSAIEKSHRIDLESVGFLHWWKFVYLFFDLDENCFFNQLVNLRRKKKRNKLTKEEKDYVRDNPELFELASREIPDDQDEFMKRYKAARERREETWAEKEMRLERAGR